MIVGSGARAAAAEVTELAERLKAPVTSEMGGRGIPGDHHELALPYPAAHRLWPRVDVVLAVGTRLMRPQSEWGLDDRLKVIRVDLDPEEIKRVAAPRVALVADAGHALQALLDGLPATAERRTGWPMRAAPGTRSRRNSPVWYRRSTSFARCARACPRTASSSTN